MAAILLLSAGVGYLVFTTINSTSHAAASRPDNWIRKSTDTTAQYVGNNIYNTTGTNQTKTRNGYRGNTLIFYVKIQNDGSVSDKFYVKGTGSNSGFTAKYYKYDSTNITSAVIAGTYKTALISPGGSVVLKVKITITSTASHGSSRYHNVTSTSYNDSTKKDLVRAKVYVY